MKFGFGKTVFKVLSVIFFGKTLFKFVTSPTAATSIVRGHRTSKTDVEVNLRQQSKVLYVGIEDIKRSKLSGNLWNFLI